MIQYLGTASVETKGPLNPPEQGFQLGDQV